MLGKFYATFFATLRSYTNCKKHLSFGSRSRNVAANCALYFAATQVLSYVLENVSNETCICVIRYNIQTLQT